jgi:prepilin-type N-terminal cleavage/methylation domain-containing protein
MRFSIQRRQARRDTEQGVQKLSRVMRKFSRGEKGFTMVELLIVMIVSLILIAGMVGLIEMGMNQLTRSRALENVTDSSRRALSSVDRQIKQALQFDDANCSDTMISFWGDVDSDNTNADVTTGTTNNYHNAEYVQFYKHATNNTLIEKITQPASEGGATSFNTVCSNVTSAKFYYFAQGTTPVYNAGTGLYTNGITTQYNASAGMIKVVLGFRYAKVSRTFEQDIFLRILNRQES